MSALSIVTTAALTTTTMSPLNFAALPPHTPDSPVPASRKTTFQSPALRRMLEREDPPSSTMDPMFADDPKHVRRNAYMGTTETMRLMSQKTRCFLQRERVPRRGKRVKLTSTPDDTWNLSKWS